MCRVEGVSIRGNGLLRFECEIASTGDFQGEGNVFPGGLQFATVAQDQKEHRQETDTRHLRQHGSPSVEHKDRRQT
jgi:hypothetical protein